MSREYTTEEVKELFLNKVRVLVDYWDTECEKERTTRERLYGLAHSIFGIIDGRDLDLPAFILAPCPQQEDMQFLVEAGENYFPENERIEEQIRGDIGGDLALLLQHPRPEVVID